MEFLNLLLFCDDFFGKLRQHGLPHQIWKRFRVWWGSWFRLFLADLVCSLDKILLLVLLFKVKLGHLFKVKNAISIFVYFIEFLFILRFELSWNLATLCSRFKVFLEANSATFVLINVLENFKHIQSCLDLLWAQSHPMVVGTCPTKLLVKIVSQKFRVHSVSKDGFRFFIWNFFGQLSHALDVSASFN